MLSSHKDFRKSLVGAVNTRPLGIEVPVVGSQWTCSDHFVAERDNSLQVGILVILVSPGSATLGLTVEKRLGEEVGSRVACPGSVAAPLVGWQHVVGVLEIADDQVQRLLFTGT